MTIRRDQQTQLSNLLETAQHTEYGKKFDFKSINTFHDFTDRLPITFYGDIETDIEKLKKGAQDIYWPGGINKFAVSAGTSGKGKHLPLSAERLQSDKEFMRKVALSYVSQEPNILELWGKQISMPGNLETIDNYTIGEISGFTAEQAPWWLSPFQLIDPKKLIELTFKEKVELVINEAVNHDVRVITAAPNWILTMFQEIIKKTGADNISKIWPNLQLLICGGVKLANYKPHLQKLIQNPDAEFIETYGASEGYFAFSNDLDRDDLQLITDNGIFYEFVPNPLPGIDSMAVQETVPLWEVKPNTPYAMLVTTNAGLWRYALNDIVKFTQPQNARIKVMGRVSEMLDEYGEALYAYEADKVLNSAARELEIEIGNFTIGADLIEGEEAPKHFWFILTPHQLHRNTLDKLAQKIDEKICAINRHYAIRRESKSLGMPVINTISQKQINGWLSNKGKDKAQGKLPAILRNRDDIQFFK